MKKQKGLLVLLQKEFAKHADEERAKRQQRYMKSSMPFWGIPLPEVKKICNTIFKNFIPQYNHEYRATVLCFFNNAQHREEWYAGMHYAGKYKKYITKENLELYLNIIRKTQWWDVVDHVAAHFVGQALKGVDDAKKYLNALIKDDNMWIRRTALLTQLKYKEETDADLLAQLILTVVNEKEFFIRKAIGWSIRQYSYIDSEWVRNFIQNHEDILSNLSIREGLKAIKRLDLLQK